MIWEFIEQFFDEIGFTDTTQTLFDTATLLGFIPEEELALGKLFLLGLGTLDWLKGIGVEPSVPRLGGNGHGCRRKILNLLQLEVEMFGFYGQIGHVGLAATRMAGDEVRDDLLVQSFLAIDTVEDALELVELLERRLAHQCQHMVGSMLWSHFQTTADMILNQFAGVLHSGLV